MVEETKNSTLEKCTHQQKWLVEQLMYNLKNDEVLWKQGWVTRGAPESAITGKKYRGSNNFLLTIVALSRGYTDNRWVTYKQMEEKGWKFKTDAEGKSLGKGAGVPVEFYTLHDRKTKKAFEKSTLFGMNEEEQQEYMKENVFPIRRSYYVFNGDLIDGIPELEKHEIDPNERVARADRFLQMWSEREVPIIHGGSMAYYAPSKDEIHLPPMNDFLTLQDYYSTAFHETGHSTGHQSRLNRKLDNKFGTPEYAEEELRAEIASMFLGQEFGVSADTNAIRNNSAYVKAWIEKLEEDPSVLFKAIADANNIMKYIVAKEQEFNMAKDVEHYAIVEDADYYGNPVYKVYMTADYGQTRPALSFAFSSKEALLQEFGKMQELPFWKDKTFVEVSKDELDKISIEKAEKGETEEIQSEPSDVYVPPSEVVAKTTTNTNPSEMQNRGVESLTRTEDREVVEKASKTKRGEKFSQLYNGISILGSEEKDEYSLMTRLAMFVNGDKEQLTVGDSSVKKQVVDYMYNAEQYTKDNILLFSGQYPQDGLITLGENEILVHYLNLENLFSNEISHLEQLDKNLAKDMIRSLQNGSVQENRDTFARLSALLNLDIQDGFVPATVQSRSTETDEKIVKDWKIVGVYFGVDNNSYSTAARYKLMVGKSFMQSYHIYEKQGDYSKILFSKESVKKGADVIVKYLTSESGFALNWYNNSVLTMISENETMIRQAADLFLYAALALAVFSIFMLYNYISTSISSKRRSVGVLRGLGAGGKDILRIFLSESLIIALINGVLACALSAVGCMLVNSYIMNTMNIFVAFALFGVRQILIISGVSVLTAFLSSALPIFKISKKKPVDLIRRA